MFGNFTPDLTLTNTQHGNTGLIQLSTVESIEALDIKEPSFTVCLLQHFTREDFT
jgi:hypothetical protein